MRINIIVESERGIMMERVHDKKEVKIVHIVPKISETERSKVLKTIGGDLYEIFSRIQKDLKIGDKI